MIIFYLYNSYQSLKFALFHSNHCHHEIDFQKNHFFFKIYDLLTKVKNLNCMLISNGLNTI